MSAAGPLHYPAPFDSAAARYDETFTSSLIGQVQRAAVWRELEVAFQPGDRTLEIGCGTGVDAAFLAGRGVHVLACDSSSEMIAVASRRILEGKLQNFVQPRVLSAENLSTLTGSERFDGAFSNFGALNCVLDLDRLAHDLAQVLKPRSSIVLCWMGPSCLWEMAWYFAKRERGKALRRLKSEGIQARIADGVFCHVLYPSVQRLVRAFAPVFSVRAIRGIGVAVPPSYMESWARRHPRLFRMCERVDSVVSRVPGVRTLGDHVLVRLERNGREPGRKLER